MIQLPSNWIDYLQISLSKNALFLHLYNDAGQFYTCYYRIDPVLPVQRTLEEVTLKIPETAAVDQAYILEGDMSLVKTEPSDQNWGPAPIPGLDVVSLEQYKALRAMPGAAEPKAPPIPGPTAGEVE